MIFSSNEPRKAFSSYNSGMKYKNYISNLYSNFALYIEFITCKTRRLFLNLANLYCVIARTKFIVMQFFFSIRMMGPKHF